MPPIDELDAAIDLEHRRLCPDGACIGVLDATGRCKVCGRIDEADAATSGGRGAGGEGEIVRAEPTEGPARAAADADDEPGDEPDDEAAAAREADGEGAADAADGAAGEGPGWTDRELCPDGACVGVIGESGRCRVCGKPKSWREPG